MPEIIESRKDMKLSLRWVSQYLTLEYSPEEIAEMLTTIGLEVEGWEKKEAVKGGLKGVVVGHVVECHKHPDADKLSLTKVNIGQEADLQIVCGAPNVQTGQKVLVATIGTTLYDADGNPWKIKKGKIRGQESEGMICAEDELGLGSDHSGIMVLDKSAPIGTEAAIYLSLPDDVVFEIGLTPNRSDATSHLGVAKDLFAYLKINKNYQGEIKLPETTEFITEKIKFNIDVDLVHKDACPRYAGITISGVKVGESPSWIRQALMAIGVKPINNIVDITNYVLHELGQPLHAFDAEKIAGNKIIVDTLPEGSPFTTLDGVERKLGKNDLMINDGDKKPLCMAGVYGGLSSGVTVDTTQIFLESAYFSPKYIRSTSTSHLLRTDAAKIFEKGADPNMVILALKRAAGLIRKYSGGAISNILVDEYPKPFPEKEIKLRFSRINSVIGVKLGKETVHAILSSMGMMVRVLDNESVLVIPGTNKHDVTREIDLIEEIIRVYGLNNVPVSQGIKSTISYTDKPNKSEVKEIMARFLANNQYHEMMGLSLVESKSFQALPELDKDSFVFINNTSNVHLDIMRPDMLVSGLLSVAHNLNRQQTIIKLFEQGKTYRKEGDGFVETEFLTLFVSGKQNDETWFNKNNRDANFFDIKQTCQGLMNRLGINGYTAIDLADRPGLHYGLSYIQGNVWLANLGQVSAGLLKAMGIKQPVFFAEWNLTGILQALTKTKLTVKEISRFPSTRRDLAIILDENTRFTEVAALSYKADKKWLKEVRLFDIFKDPQKIGANKKSYAISYHFENNERTLSDEEVDKVMARVTAELESQLKANIRK